MAIPITVRCECGETHKANLGDRRRVPVRPPLRHVEGSREQLSPRCGSTRPRRGSTCGWARSSSSPHGLGALLHLGLLGGGDHRPHRRHALVLAHPPVVHRRYVSSPGELPTLELEATKDDARDARPPGSSRSGPGRAERPSGHAPDAERRVRRSRRSRSPSSRRRRRAQSSTSATRSRSQYRNYVGHVARQYAEQLIRKHLDAVARRARARGVTTTQLAFHNPRPVKIAVEVAKTEQIGLLVFGPNPKAPGEAFLPQGGQAHSRGRALPRLDERIGSAGLDEVGALLADHHAGDVDVDPDHARE